MLQVPDKVGVLDSPIKVSAKARIVFNRFAGNLHMNVAPLEGKNAESLSEFQMGAMEPNLTVYI